MGSKEPIGDKPTPTVSSHEGRRSRVGRLRLPYLLGHYPARLVLGGVPVRQWLSDNWFIGLLRHDFGNPVDFSVAGADGVLTVPESDAAGRMSPKHVMRPRCWDPLWLCFALADGLDSRFADNSGRRSCGARVVCGTFPGRDRHPHGLAGHLASTGGCHHPHHRVGDHHSALPLVDCRSGSYDTGPSGTDHQQTRRHRVPCLGCRCS